MELLIAVLIAFGVVSSGEASLLDTSSAEKLIQENQISKSDMEKEAAIIGLEESDM